MNSRSECIPRIRVYPHSLLHRGPPFTIQRVCELCLRPTEHYKTVGKYLRAVEKSLLVTSSWEAFPPETESDIPAALANISMHSTILSTTPATPLFSPIPFLHDDARRSKTRSPPPSPLALGTTDSGGIVPIDSLEQKAIGLVDELDDPSPGHMSEHLTALSSVTTTTTVGSRPFLGSLEERFTKGVEERPVAQEEDDDAMVVDEVEDKENKG
jgi:serine/threonine-protein phosphatase 4 regulatory subunit 2